jgi:hypothetical protein
MLQAEELGARYKKLSFPHVFIGYDSKRDLHDLLAILL